MSTSPSRRRAALAAAVMTLAAVTASCSAGSTTGGSATAGEGGATAAAAADPDATLEVGFATVPASLDFTSTGGAAIVQALVGNVYEGLVQVDGGGEIQPLLATAWSVSDDGLRYSFTLREGVTFHDGSPFSAETVKFSLERIKDWTANTPANLAALDHVEVVSDTEVVVVLSEPNANALLWLAGPLGAMFDPDSVGNLAVTANGTGPFTFESYDQGVAMTLSRNDAYWGEPAGVARATFVYYADASAAANALRTGGMDALFQAEAYDQIASFEASDEYTVTIGSTQGVVVSALNGNREALADPRVRQAISYAVDKEAVLAAATSGYGTILGGPAVPTDPYYVDLADTYAYDPEKATELLTQAGATSLSLTFTVPNRPYAQAVAQVIQSDLAAVGVTATLEQQEFPAVWLEQTFTNHEFDMSVTNHVESRNVWNYANPDYYWSYSSDVADGYFAEARAAVDADTYDASMAGAIQQIVDDAASLWLYNPPNIVVARVGVTGLPQNYMGVGIALAGVTVTE